VTLEEANKIIAEYMGQDWQDCKCGYDVFKLDYFDSLDALVPVWDKLKPSKYIGLDYSVGNDSNRFRIWNNDYDLSSVNDYSEDEFTIQEAACLATAKAIKELND